MTWHSAVANSANDALSRSASSSIPIHRNFKINFLISAGFAAAGAVFSAVISEMRRIQFLRGVFVLCSGAPRNTIRAAADSLSWPKIKAQSSAFVVSP
jgi:hypothetical protein